MTWFAFQGLNGGKAINLAGTQEKQAVGTGFHGYGTEAQAESNPNSVNFLTRVEADAFISDYQAAVKQQSQPGGANANITNPATAAKAAIAGSPVGSAISSVEGFVSAFGNKTLWIRVAKVALGGAILIVGVVELTGISGKVANTVKKMPIIV
jgi:hypothetical protein